IAVRKYCHAQCILLLEANLRSLTFRSQWIYHHQGCLGGVVSVTSWIKRAANNMKTVSSNRPLSHVGKRCLVCDFWGCSLCIALSLRWISRQSLVAFAPVV